jgi:hypothetical protein
MYTYTCTHTRTQALHWYGDGLWEAAGKPRPNAGFIDGHVMPTESKQDTKSSEESKEKDKENKNLDDESQRGGGDFAGKEDDGKARTHDADEDDLDADGDDNDGDAQGVSREEMDALLEMCFLQAVKTTVKEKLLPMEASVFYLQHMRPARQVGMCIFVCACPFAYTYMGDFVFVAYAACSAGWDVYFCLCVSVCVHIYGRFCICSTCGLLGWLDMCIFRSLG